MADSAIGAGLEGGVPLERGPPEAGKYVVTTIDKSCGPGILIIIAQSHEHVAVVASIHRTPLRKSTTDKSIPL